jgi:CDP-diacylglycerol--serine O-phosphatidyltransferase
MPTPPDPSAPIAYRRRPGRFRRGAAILPSLFTTGNLFLGFWAVIKTTHGEYQQAAPMIAGAIVLDLLDGYIARLTGTTSEFGGELDSLADVISFGVAPALLAYSWAFGTIERVGWLAAFLFVVCGALRLARFNVQRNIVDSRYFVGLPIPAAAAQVAAWVIFIPEPLSSRAEAAAGVVLMTVWAFLMVSTFRYRSFKKLDLRSRRSYITVLGIALLFLLVALEPRVVLLVLATGYWLSAPALYLAGLGRRRRGVAAETVGDTQETPHTA